MPAIARLRRFAVLPLLLCAAFAAAQAPPAASAADGLEPGEYLWHPEIAPHGPTVLVISLDEQRAYVYRNGIAIGVSTISSGREGKETPAGVFTILQKNREHYSNLYDNAPMPYMQRLTWDGIALHGGTLPGHPASHGCMRLPHAFAEKLFAVTRNGDTVVVADARASPASLVHPSVLAPIDASGRATPPADALGDHFWDDDASPAGPLSVLVSVADRRVFVLRNGVTIGEAPLRVDPAFSVGGSVLMAMGDDPPDAAPERRWTAYPILGVDADSLALLQLRLQQRPIQIDEAFSQRLRGALAPGATILLTDLPAVRATPAAQDLVPVLESAPPVDVPDILPD